MIEIIIDKEEEKKTIGVIENEKLIEVYEENKENKHERNEGNIYVGIVKDIIPGMQAAFIDIGTEKNSFIHVRDIMPQIDEKIERKEEKKIKDLVKPKQKLYKPCYTLYVTLNSVGEKDVISNRKSQ